MGRSPSPARGADAVAVLALAALASLVLFLAAAPLTTSDAWFHLALGETYAEEGPWPSADPLLFTAHEDAPVQHEWLFGVLVHLIERSFGFHGLRMAHALAVAGIIALAYSLFRRESSTLAGACLASCVFLVIAWWRLWQLRPDLASIPAAMLGYRLVLEDSVRRPTWKRAAGFALLLLVWVNLHSLFLIALLLTAAGLVGLRVRELVARRLGSSDAPAGTARHSRRLALILLIGLAASLVNPRGLQQHLTFVSSSRESRIWQISDEWSPFVPWDPGRYGLEVTTPTWLAATGVIVAFVVAAAVSIVRFARRPSAASLRAADPVLLFLSGASLVAMCASVRFLWMAVFPLLFVLRASRAWLEPRPSARRLAPWLAALACVASCVALVRAQGYRDIVPPRAGYLEQGYSVTAFPADGVRFLQETQLEGRIYCRYDLGGFVGYWLAPRLRTFIDGRTEHYPVDVFDDDTAIVDQVLPMTGESFLSILERRGVDVVLGAGLPMGREDDVGLRRPTPLLRGMPGWMLVFRTFDQAVYLRTSPSNSDNAARVAAFYARERVPFDPSRGLDPSEVVRRAPDWARAHRMLPLDHERVDAASRDSEPFLRSSALERLGLAYALIDAFELEVEVDRKLIELAPEQVTARRRLVFGSLALGRSEEAVREATRLAEIAPDDAWLRRFQNLVSLQARLRPQGAWGTELDRAVFLNRLPLLDWFAYDGAVRKRYSEATLAPRSVSE